jgi:hypothetical protein
MADISVVDRDWHPSKDVVLRQREALKILKEVQKMAESLHEQYRAEMAKFSPIVHGISGWQLSEPFFTSCFLLVPEVL